MKPPPSLQRRPAPGLRRAAEFERQFVKGAFPGIFGDAALGHQPQQIAVGADVVETVIVNAHVADVRRHQAAPSGVRPNSRNSASPVASNCKIAAPIWKPCVHSVQPRAV